MMVHGFALCRNNPKLPLCFGAKFLIPGPQEFLLMSMGCHQPLLPEHSVGIAFAFIWGANEILMLS